MIKVIFGECIRYFWVKGNGVIDGVMLDYVFCIVI